MNCILRSTDFGLGWYCKVNIFGIVKVPFVLYNSASANLVIRQVLVPESRRHLTQGTRRGHQSVSYGHISNICLKYALNSAKAY